MRKINTQEFDEAFQYFKVVYESKKYLQNNNFYLYMLNLLIDLPLEYKEIAENLTLEDIMLPEVQLNERQRRTYVFNSEYVMALKISNQIINEQGKSRIVDVISRGLIKAIIEKNKIIVVSEKDIIDLINNEKYEEALRCLGQCTLRNKRDKDNIYVKALIEALIDIQNGIIPEKENTRYCTIYNLIDHKDYKRALELFEKLNLPNPNFVPKNHLIYILLIKINEALEKVQGTKESKQSYLQESKDSFVKVITNLINQDFDNAFKVLKTYLKSINQSEFEFLIMDLIKISLIEKDVAFTKPMLTLTYMAKGTFKFNADEYIQNFYESISLENYQEAKIYLDIISQINMALAESLKQALNGKISESNDFDLVQTELEESVDEISEQTVITSPKKVNNVDVIYKNDIEYIESHLQQLYENGILLLEPMDNKRRGNIHRFIDKIPDIKSFSIGEGSSRRVVLKFNPYQYGYIDVKKLANEAYEAYNNSNYDNALEKLKPILEFGDPATWVYARIGLIYMKKAEIKLAIDYLTVATELSIERNEDYDFTQLILNLQGKNRVKIKPHVDIIEDEFDDNIEKYGIENIQKILDYMSNSYGGVNVSFNMVCIKYNLDKEQENIVALILAREYYAHKMFVTGDKFLKLVEKTKNKTDLVKSLYKEVSNRKPFYQNMPEENKRLKFIHN